MMGLAVVYLVVGLLLTNYRFADLWCDKFSDDPIVREQRTQVMLGFVGSATLLALVWPIALPIVAWYAHRFGAERLPQPTIEDEDENEYSAEQGAVHDEFVIEKFSDTLVELTYSSDPHAAFSVFLNGDALVCLRTKINQAITSLGFVEKPIPANNTMHFEMRDGQPCVVSRYDGVAAFYTPIELSTLERLRIEADIVIKATEGMLQ